jgi:hypothetical protein
VEVKGGGDFPRESPAKNRRVLLSSPSTMDVTGVHDANVVAAYLAQNADRPIIDARSGSTAIVLVGSAMLPTMRAVFDYLADIEITPTSPITLVLCGGIGHSTPLLRDAICDAYPEIKPNDVKKLPEARIFEKAMLMAWPGLCDRIDRGEIVYMVEEESTNCGANANLAVDMMVSSGVSPENLIIVQDPTMMKRTIASFEKAYDTLETHSKPKQIISWSTFTPHLSLEDKDVKWYITDFCDNDATVQELWTMDRFLGLIIGEIARLNDDVDGYGPKGKGFIGHVDIPENVLESWRRMKAIGGGRQPSS